MDDSNATQTEANGNSDAIHTRPAAEPAPVRPDGGSEDLPAGNYTDARATGPTGQPDRQAVDLWLATHKAEMLERRDKGDHIAVERYREVLLAHARGEDYPAWLTVEGNLTPAHKYTEPVEIIDGVVQDHTPTASADQKQIDQLVRELKAQGQIGEDIHTGETILRALDMPLGDLKLIASRMAAHKSMGWGDVEMSQQDIADQIGGVKKQLGANYEPTVQAAIVYLKHLGLDKDWNAQNLGSIAYDTQVLQRLALAAKRKGLV